MGFFEYFFERKNPGKVGEIHRNDQTKEPTSIVVTVIKLMISIAVIYGLFYVTVMQSFNLVNFLVFVLIISCYCIICYRYIPRPDISNMGLFGGLIDHPFKFTDDINRSLLWLYIVMCPGRFVATTMVETFMIVKRLLKK